MRKLQTTGKTSSRAGTALYGVRKAQPGARTSCAGTFVSLEFQLQQQPQATIFRPSAIKFWGASFPGQKQRSKTSTGCCAGNASTRESHSVYYTSAGSLLPLWLRYKQSLTHRRSGQPANRSSRRNQFDSSRVSPSCCYLSSLSDKYHCQSSIRIFSWPCRPKAGGFYKHSETRISHERSSDSKIAFNAIWANCKNIRRNYRKCRIRHFSCRSFCLSGSSRPDSEGFFNLVRRDRLVPSWNSAMAMGSYFGRPEFVSAFIESQQQGVKTSAWQLFRLSYVRSVGKLLDISSSETPALPEPFNSRFSKGPRSRSWCKKTWSLGSQRVEKGNEALESLPPWANFAKTTESGYKANPQQIQDSCEMRASVRRQVYGCSLQKPQKKVACSLVFRKKSRKGRADKQPGRKGFAKACNLAKNFTGQQIAEWADFRSEINDNYNLACPAGPKHYGFSRNHAQKFSSGISTAKTELETRCLKQQKHFAHLTVGNPKIFRQSGAYAKISSCGGATT